jgi:delta-aminolevulinic acid dehydratase/porphobilinogen synthase
MYCPNYTTRGLASVTRRISVESEVELEPRQFAQPVDIELSLAHGVRDLPNMPGYPRRSVDAAMRYIHECTEVGMRQFLIRIVDGGDQAKDTSFGACLRRLDRQASVISMMRAAFPEHVFYIDPFGLALGRDDQWGATDGDGNLSLPLTERMFTQAVEGYAGAGASYVLTLGRFPSEVALANDVINHLQSQLRICTFSTNTETTQAYAYLTQQESYRDSEQKVLPQNFTEME